MPAEPRPTRLRTQALPILRLTPREFRDLLDYSASLPTGTTPGKRWKRLDGAHDFAFHKAGGQPRWIIGEYDPSHDGVGPRIKINWYRPIICVRAAVRRAEVAA